MGPARRAREYIEQLSADDLSRSLLWAERLGRTHGLAREEARDLVHEAVMRLLETNPYLDSEEGFRRYLATSIRNVAFDLLRVHRMEARHGRIETDEETIEQVPAETPLIEPGDLEKFLAQLSPRERDVVLLTLQGHSSPEIAKHLSIEPATVRSLLRRARARFAVVRGRNDD